MSPFSGVVRSDTKSLSRANDIDRTPDLALCLQPVVEVVSLFATALAVQFVGTAFHVVVPGQVGQVISGTLMTT